MEIEKLKSEKEKLLQSLSQFLNEEQIKVLMDGGLGLFKQWSNSSVIKALKFRYLYRQLSVILKICYKI